MDGWTYLLIEMRRPIKKVPRSIISSKYLQNLCPRMVFGHAKHSKLAGEFRSTDLTVWRAYVGYLEMYGLRFDGVLQMTFDLVAAG